MRGGDEKDFWGSNDSLNVASKAFYEEFKSGVWPPLGRARRTAAASSIIIRLGAPAPPSRTPYQRPPGPNIWQASTSEEHFSLAS